MDLGDEVIRRHSVGRPDHEPHLAGIGKDGKLAEDDDIGIGHRGAEHVDKAFGLYDVVTGHLEGPSVVSTQGRIVSDQ